MFVIFVFVGNDLLDVFGVSTAGFRMTGGLVLLLMAIEIVFGLSIMRKRDQSVAWVKWRAPY